MRMLFGRKGVWVIIPWLFLIFNKPLKKALTSIIGFVFKWTQRIVQYLFVLASWIVMIHSNRFWTSERSPGLESRHLKAGSERKRRRPVMTDHVRLKVMSTCYMGEPWGGRVWYQIRAMETRVILGVWDKMKTLQNSFLDRANLSYSFLRKEK